LEISEIKAKQNQKKAKPGLSLTPLDGMIVILVWDTVQIGR
jgi:hypothetical protein